MKRKKKRRAHRRKAQKRRNTKRSRSRNSRRAAEARIRDLRAINRARRGEALTEAARAEGTTVESIKRTLPGALLPSRPGKPPRVRTTDRYSAPVEILNDSGSVQVVTARGSKERKLAGQHRADYMGVLRGTRPASTLRKYRPKTVGGQKLLTDPDLLFELAEGGVIDNLMPLYVSPE